MLNPSKPTTSPSNSDTNIDIFFTLSILKSLYLLLVGFTNNKVNIFTPFSLCSLVNLNIASLLIELLIKAICLKSILFFKEDELLK